MNDVDNKQMDLKAHYTTETKIKRPARVVANPPNSLPRYHLISDKEMSAKMGQINNDIYQGANSEKTKHQFNKASYFKIFGGITALTCGLAGFKKLKSFFKKS